MNGYWSVALKELLHLRRDPVALVIALLLPLIQLTIFGFAIEFDLRHMQTAVVDMDRSRESRAYIARLRSTQYIDPAVHLRDVSDAERYMRMGRVRLAIIIPPDFARRMTDRDHPTVRALVDGSDSQAASRAMRALLPPPDIGRPGVVEPRVDVLYNPAMRTPTFIIPGLIGIVMQIVTISLTSFSLVREKEQGTLEQVMVSPIGKLGLMLGKLTPYAVLGIAEMVVVVVLGRIVFDVRVAGSVALLMLASVPFILASLAIGLVISTVARTQGEALQYVQLTTLPSVLLSGFMFPREAMPGPIYLFSFLLPVTHFIDILRGVIVRGAGLGDLWTSVAALLVLMAALIALATARFRKSIA